MPAGKRGAIGATAGLSVLFALGCGHPPPEGVANVDILATVPSGVLVDTVDFRISSPKEVLASGRIHTPKPQNELHELVTHVPITTDERVDLTAKSTDGMTSCAGSAPIEVRKGATTRVHVMMQCHGAGDGMVKIVVGVECAQAQLTSYSVTPLAASVGGTIAVSATAAGVDGGTLKYAWRATSGTFTDPTASATSYRCSAPGPVTITLVVSQPTCDEDYMSSVTCLAQTDADAGAD